MLFFPLLRYDIRWAKTLTVPRSHEATQIRKNPLIETAKMYIYTRLTWYITGHSREAEGDMIYRSLRVG